MGTRQDRIQVPVKQTSYRIIRKNFCINRVTEKLEWKIPENSKWSITPERMQRKYEPGKERANSFRIRFSGDIRSLFPLPFWVSTVSNADFGLVRYTNKMRLDMDPFVAQNVKREKVIRAKGEIVIDGIFNESEWKDATLLSPLYTPDYQQKAAFETIVKCAYDDMNLYFALDCIQSNEPLTRILVNDGNLWEDDNVELYIKPEKKADAYYQFTVNSKGYVYDARVFDRSWNSAYSIKTVKTGKGWKVEAALPWSAFGMASPKPGETLYLEISRTHKSSPFETSQWSPTFGGNHEPSRFGILQFE
jgi:hypothetical protein